MGAIFNRFESLSLEEQATLLNLFDPGQYKVDSKNAKRNFLELGRCFCECCRLVPGWRSWEGGAEEASADSLGKQHPALRRLRVWGKNSKELGLIGELMCAVTYAKTQVEGSGLYPKIARINHSCAPNSIWTWVARDRSRRRKEVRSGFSASSAWKN